MIAILAKELGVGARLKRTYALRALYGIALALSLWLSLGWHAMMARMTMSQYAALGRELFDTFVIVQFVGMTVFALLAGADMIVKEIRSDTLGLLCMTPMSGTSMVAGKWLAAIAQSAYLLLCGLPVLAACIYLGGVSLQSLAAGLVSALASAALAAAFAVWMSCGRQSPTGAGVYAGLLYLGHLTLCWLLQETTGNFRFFGYVCPVGALLGSSSSQSMDYEYGWALILPVCALVSSSILRRAGTLLRSPETLLPRNVRESHEILDRQAYIEQAAINLGTRARSFDVWDRFPLLWKDIRTRAAAQLSYEIRLGVGSFLAIIFLGCVMSGVDAARTYFVALFSLGIPLAAALGSGLFFRDRDAGRGETLRVLPVGSWQVVAAKLASGPASPEGTAYLSLLTVSLLPCFAAGGLWAGLSAAAFAYNFLIFVYSLGALASLLLHKTRLAILASSAATVGILIWSGASPLNPFACLRGYGEPGLFSGVYLTATVVVAWTLFLLHRAGFRR